MGLFVVRVTLSLVNSPDVWARVLGYNHSGRYGQVNFLAGVMGFANAQRALNYIRIIAEFISQPEWANVVPVFGIVNEPSYTAIGSSTLRSL
jgi:glucan 1,3-beta-glucosidase